MKCVGCDKRARARDLFCSNRCAHAYALELLATDDTRICPHCRKLVGVSVIGWDARCDECNRDVSDAPTAWDRCFGGNEQMSPPHLVEQAVHSLEQLRETLDRCRKSPDGPCMPRVEDGRCIWCERQLPMRSA